MAVIKKKVAKPEAFAFSKHRKEAMTQLLDQLDKTVGKGVGRPLPQQLVKLARVNTGILGMDYITGGWVPKGRISEFFGTESGGKTSLALVCMAQCQRAGGTVAFIDAEQSFDPSWAATMGVDIGTMLFDQPMSGEKAIETALLMAKSRAVDLVVIDSVSALVPQAELDGTMTESQMGAQAKLMSKALRKLVEPVNAAHCAMIFINQLRENIGNAGYGSPEVTSGGRALKFYASLRLDVRKGKPLMAGETQVGQEVMLKCVKNKTATPHRRCTVPFTFGKGFDTVGELVDVGTKCGVLRVDGSWYKYDGKNVAQGRERTVAWLTQAKPELQELFRVAALDYLENGVIYGA